jgi:hypothetical protein
MNMKSLGDYVSQVLDTNKDGKVTFKDFVDLFPNSAIAIAIIFVDLAVLVAEYRVWDVGYQMTRDPYKAFGFVLVSAIPFYLGQIFWLYPVANFIQKSIAVLMVGSALYTSWIFGTADLSRSYDVESVIGMVVNMTAFYIVGVLGYVLIDDGIKAHRMKKEAEGAAKREREYQRLTREILRDLAETQRLQNETAKEFGDEDLVERQLQRFRGNKPKQGAPAFQPMAQKTEKPPELDGKPNPTNGGAKPQ